MSKVFVLPKKHEKSLDGSSYKGIPIIYEEGVRHIYFIDMIDFEVAKRSKYTIEEAYNKWNTKEITSFLEGVSTPTEGSPSNWTQKMDSLMPH